jgi:hypothetical protein
MPDLERWTRRLAWGLAPWLGGCAPFTFLTEAPARPEPAAAAAVQRSDMASRYGGGNHEDAVVRIVAGTTSCTGTLIDRDLVLTAHHCVALRGPNGQYLDQHVAFADVRVELGGDYLPWAEVAVRSIIAPPCGFGAGEGDIAVLILEQPLEGVELREPDLDMIPAPGTYVEPIGFGRCASSEDGIRRHARTGGEVETLRPTRFQVTAAVCPGDSGAPALDPRTGKVVGVLSASIMDGAESTASLTEFTRLDKWRSVIAAARQVASGTNPAELPPLECEVQ